MSHLNTAIQGNTPAIQPCHCGSGAIIGKELESKTPIRKERIFVQCSGCGQTNKFKIESGETVGFASEEDAVVHWNGTGREKSSGL